MRTIILRLAFWKVILINLGQHLSAGITISQTNHHGWSNAWILQNSQAEVIVVPSIGRIQQFRFRGETDGPFWENPVLLGKSMPTKPWDVPGSFGGDKTWPAPQSAWNWPPPDVFDTAAVTAEIVGTSLVLRSPVSPRFGIQTERTISLDPLLAKLIVRTRFLKISGNPVEVGVWVITQTQVPDAAYLPVPQPSVFKQGLATLWDIPESNLTRMPGLIEFRRDPKASAKIGNDAASLIWVGTRWCLRIDSPRIPHVPYPDGGCSAELYSNPDPAGYVEMETLGPIQKLAIGESMSSENVYTLSRRQETNAVAEARRLLELP